MTLLTRLSPVLLVATGMLAAAPLAALAQGGSTLYAVGEKDGRSRPTAKPKTPAAQPAQASKPSASTKKASKTSSKKHSRSKSPAKSPIALGGRWHDSQCIPLTGSTHSPPLYVKRQYEFDDKHKTWLLDAAVYTSNACIANAKMLSYHGEGTFSVTGKSRVASNAYDASFEITRWSAMPHNRDGVMAMLNGRCGSGDFETGRSLDLSGTGCALLGIRSIAQSPSETELVSVSDGKFFMGTRSFAPGLSEERPAQLSSYGLVRTP